ncbi:prolyl oligopeptidase family serine peptidase [Herbiconiux moechotypicola]|uniref:Peptidase S9 prolyl oligopeptidase catalytic domain-containing protein n=1 Tax=Herbiconiux moechotypicola TaxID=637393 RepID=A0ABP5Q3I0_9MICO|nr:prolyl oligopeptidase family serine peptidase [Herbiconiux moechotypicola]MCS5729105.1 prolyl oligopeptidase family serine peptidase [Herbiconiux moechotypicola]
MTTDLTRRGVLGLAAAGGLGVALGAAGAFGPGAATPAAASALGAARSAGAAGRATATAGTTAPSALAPAVTAAATPDPGLTPFPQQTDLNFQTLTAYGEAAYQAGEVGEVASAVAAVQAAITAGGAEAIPAYQPYADSFEALAAQLAGEADAELAAGRLVTARARYLRAASYYNCVLFFVLGTDAPGREAEVYAAMQRCWAAAASLMNPVLQRVEVPASVRFRELDGTVTTRTVTLPAYWGRASGAGSHPTVIINNGSDAQLVDLWAFGGAAALERGYNVLMFEGPGQGSLLFEQNIPFTPYWGDVITPLVDFALSQPETDASRLALTGWSFGGLLVMRAAATEHRLAAVVADPGFWDNTQPWQPLVEAMEQYFGSVSNANWMELFEGTTPAYGTDGQDALKFLVNKRGEIYGSALHDEARSGGVVSDIVGLLDALTALNADAALMGEVTSHVLLNEYESDVFFSGQGAQVEAWLTKAASVSNHLFGYATGTEFHCAPMAPQVRNEVVFDWLDSVLGVTPVPPPTPTPVVPPAPVTPPALAATGASGAGALTGAVTATAAVAAGAAAVGAGAAISSRRSRTRSDQA